MKKIVIMLLLLAGLVATPVFAQQNQTTLSVPWMIGFHSDYQEYLATTFGVARENFRIGYSEKEVLICPVDEDASAEALLRLAKNYKKLPPKYYLLGEIFFSGAWQVGEQAVPKLEFLADQAETLPQAERKIVEEFLTKVQRDMRLYQEEYVSLGNYTPKALKDEVEELKLIAKNYDELQQQAEELSKN